MKEKGVRRGVLAAFLLVIMAIVAPVTIRWLWPAEMELIQIEGPDGRTWGLSIRELEHLPTYERRGEVQNQFGNWRDAGVYSGVRLRDLPGMQGDYELLTVVASDGYQTEIERARIEDEAYPMILALSFDAVPIPKWEDGPRIVVLPLDGRVSNEESGLVSAGSLWVKNVERLVLR